MAWTNYQLALALGMVVTGSINTLATKWADLQDAPGCATGDHPQSHPFSHPFLQAVGMFIGEFSCLIAFKVLWFSKKVRGRSTDDMGNQNFSPFLLFIPAMCDMTGTSLIFQMLRGAVIVFTALLSVAFLQRVITSKMWSGIVCVIIGLVLVGLSDILFPDESGTESYSKNELITASNNSLVKGILHRCGERIFQRSSCTMYISDLIIIIAQIVAATQMVVEEKFVSGRDINPLQAVGWEGFFGMTTLGTLLIPMYFIITGHNNGVPTRLEDSIDGLCQLGNNWRVALGTFGSVASIAFFNFFGISVTKELSATTRMVLDSIRTVVIWAVSLALRWQSFQYLQVIGFVILIFGTAVYNNIFRIPCIEKKVHPINSSDYGGDYDEESQPILGETEDDMEKDN